jgi:hypothetical protein
MMQPEPPGDPAPGDDWLSVKADRMVTLSWKECRGISGYGLRLQGDPTAGYVSLIKTNGYTNNSLTVGPLPNGSYSWFVTSLGGGECYFPGPVWHFALTTPKAGDSDNDGIPDSWEQAYFHSLFPANGTTDRDGDGVNDWQEYVAGTDPTNRLDAFRICGCRSVPDGVAVDWNSASGRTYTLYSSTAMTGLDTQGFLFDRVTGNGTLMSRTNDWPDPAGFLLIGVGAPDLP